VFGCGRDERQEGCATGTFDLGSGDPMVAVADGTDQPGRFGITIGINVDGPDKGTVAPKKDGKILATGVWTLAKDGTKPTDRFTAAWPNGDTTSLDYVYKRKGGGSGFAATWVSESEQMNSTFVIQRRPWEGDGLSFNTSGGGGTKNVKFDGKYHLNPKRQGNLDAHDFVDENLSVPSP
jgi:hypothetical protein